MWIYEVYMKEEVWKCNSPKVWKAIRPTGDKPYKAKSQQEIQKLVGWCYADTLPEIKRTREVTQEEYDQL